MSNKIVLKIRKKTTLNPLSPSRYCLLLVSFFNNTYDPYFGTKESQYLIYFIQTQGFFTLLQFAYKAQPNARSHCQLRLRKA